ncbi:hypothetical protein PLICRDRAFT_350142 [Plicaturopsis crispa FD-325 SS-3]|uniref:Cupredoxin n=1 Tax=Plicaturopsis crispa FD-325 SS-3 TaxID=944288 RepID=A0A0C9T9N9_PLICR|nr:hypothetical protein PLICRDRAFT_350142 [Plicaturopsis crispa FD-325 SS-3]
MRLLAAASALALAVTASAQNTTIQVGAAATAQGGAFVFNPSSVTAKNGSVITFQFTGSPGNHSVTQSSFSDPCDPLADGFDSGWVFIPPNTSSDFPSWNLTITDDSKPIWFYCKALIPSPHCKVGMVGAINAPSSGSNTFSAFQKAAESFSGTPGQGQGFLVGSGASASAAVGPLSGSIQGFGIPTATGPVSGAASSTSSSSGSAATNSASSASTIAANSMVVLVAAMLGITLA